MKQDIMQEYFDQTIGYMTRIKQEERERIDTAAKIIADQIQKDKLIYIWGPGGHSNMNAMEIFFRAGGLMHVSAILDEGTIADTGTHAQLMAESAIYQEIYHSQLEGGIDHG